MLENSLITYYVNSKWKMMESVLAAALTLLYLVSILLHNSSKASEVFSEAGAAYQHQDKVKKRDRRDHCSSNEAAYTLCARSYTLHIIVF